MPDEDGYLTDEEEWFEQKWCLIILGAVSLFGIGSWLIYWWYGG